MMSRGVLSRRLVRYLSDVVAGMGNGERGKETI